MGGKDKTIRVTWSIRKGAKTLVERAGQADGSAGRHAGGASQSSYVSNLIEQRAAEWEAALEHLLNLGWKKGAIRRACEQLPNPPAFTTRPVQSVRAAVSEGDISEGAARALLVLAKEIAAGNAEFAGRL